MKRLEDFLRSVGARIMILLLIVVSAVSCKQDEIGVVDNISFHLINREANYLFADNIKYNQVKFEANGKVSLGWERLQLREMDTIRVSDYILGFSTCNVSLDSIATEMPYIKERYNSPTYNSIYQSPYMMLAAGHKMANDADETLEMMLQVLLMKLSTQNMKLSERKTRTFVKRVDYRTTPLTGIKITCSDTFNGVLAGQSLNNFFEVNGYPHYHEFVITHRKDVVGSGITNISIAKYLALSPMAPAAMYLNVKKGVEVDAHKKVQFTIKLELDNGRTIEATTQPIVLAP